MFFYGTQCTVARKKFTQPQLQIARGRRFCHFVDGGLIDTEIISRTIGIFHYLSYYFISVQISPK